MGLIPGFTMMPHHHQQQETRELNESRIMLMCSMIRSLLVGGLVSARGVIDCFAAIAIFMGSIDNHIAEIAYEAQRLTYVLVTCCEAGG
jgi:hypothetical protein